MRLVLTARARAEYKAIRAYSLREYGTAQASRYRQQFVEAFERLLEFPELGKAAEHIASGARQMPVGRHVVYYQLAQEEMVIVAILHERQLPNGL
ncbi:type II toxin-antitoxin system RelE/ParE family toxin [Maricaulis sp.]|uniref:type II toxin-antitoxin system RelE/ParE family toxin n=1 Tax=Maricaulis sp. TaxID=1486257 RepID=UPI00262397E5|nr:type II toxin-antitoxin system RelE/ParE family toxin [Maricaulis sp.]